MSKIKRISVNSFEKIMKDNVMSETFDWHGIEVSVNKNLSLEEMLEFVDMVVKSCFTADENKYMPELKDFAIKTCVLEKYANFTMPRDVKKQYALIYNTDAFEKVLEHINMKQFDEIYTAISEKITNIAQANIEAVNRQMNELYNAFDNLQTQLSDLFSGVNNDDMLSVINAVSNGGIDEGKLVEAYMNTKKDENNG